MPIRDENKARYPANWHELSRWVRFTRAEGRCECEGECGREHPSVRCLARHGWTIPADGYRPGGTVVLTVAHLDQTPEHCDPDNLLAMCQACHLRYDRHLHAANARATRRARRAAGELFRDPDDVEAQS